MFDLKAFRILNKLTQAQLADYLGVTQAFVSQVENGSRPMPEEYISKIEADKVYDLSKAYMLNKSNLKNKGLENTQYVNYKLLPLINLDVVGGSDNQEADTAQYIKDYIPFVNAREEDVCCPVTGRSMEPLYPGGCIIQIRRIYKWRQFLEYGQVYVLDLDDGRRLIKEVKKGKDESCYLLRSCNKEYEDQEIPVNMIYSIWLVVAKYEKATM